MYRIKIPYQIIDIDMINITIAINVRKNSLYTLIFFIADNADIEQNSIGINITINKNAKDSSIAFINLPIAISSM